MNRVDKLIAVAVITGFLLLLFSIGFDFINGKGFPSFDIREPFAGLGQASAPTRAADCRCLPGYIPSKLVQGDRIVFIKEYGVYGYINSKNEFYYMGQNCNQCGQNFCSRAEDMKYGDLVIKINKTKEIIDKGFFSCSVVQPSQPSNTYRCQRLSDSTDFKMCY